jgi:hypothetical protein
MVVPTHSSTFITNSTFENYVNTVCIKVPFRYFYVSVLPLCVSY